MPSLGLITTLIPPTPPTMCIEQVRELNTWQMGRPWVSHSLGTVPVVYTEQGDWGEVPVYVKGLGPASI